MTASPLVTAEQLTLPAVDGRPLAATRYPVPPDGGPTKGHLVVAAATAVPRPYYRRFAEYAAARGYPTLTFDYRGIGGSRPASLRGFAATMLDWAELDLAAAVALAAQAARADGVPLHLVGHSFGGQAIGLLPDPSALTSAYVVGTGTGWHGHMPLTEQVRIWAMWNLAGPVLTRWKGYLPWSLLGGEDLPLGVYRQWRHWCAEPGWAFRDPAFAHLTSRFEQVRTPIVAVSATDDRWAPPASRDALMAGYRNAPWRAVDVDPRTSGLGPIGHMGYFRPPARPLWDAALDAFDEAAARRP